MSDLLQHLPNWLTNGASTREKAILIDEIKRGKLDRFGASWNNGGRDGKIGADGRDMIKKKNK